MKMKKKCSMHTIGHMEKIPGNVKLSLIAKDDIASTEYPLKNYYAYLCPICNHIILVEKG